MSPAAFVYFSMGLPGLIDFLIWVCIIVLIFGALVWLCRYLGAPALVEKILIVIGVLIVLGGLLEAFTGYGHGGAVIVR